MEITSKNISHNERLSEETNCFSATIYIDGKKAGEASNHGHGGPTMIHPANSNRRSTPMPRPFLRSRCRV